MKIFVAISCVLMVASARPQDTHHHHYYFGDDAQVPAPAMAVRSQQYNNQASNFDLSNPSNWNPQNWNLANMDPSNWKANMQQMASFWKNSNWRQSLKNWRQGQQSSYAPGAQAKNQVVVGYAAPAKANFDVSEIMSNPWGSLDKASASLDDLNKDFPDVLAKLDPSIKDDVKEVNNIVIEICKQMVSGAKSDSIFFSQAGLKSSCDYINNTAREISLGMDDPAVVSQLIDSLKDFTTKFNGFRPSGSSKSY